MREETEPYPPHDSWLIQRQTEDGSWVPYAPTDLRTKALERIRSSRMQYPMFEHRLLRVTTSYTTDEED